VQRGRLMDGILQWCVHAARVGATQPYSLFATVSHSDLCDCHSPFVGYRTHLQRTHLRGPDGQAEDHRQVRPQKCQPRRGRSRTNHQPPHGEVAEAPPPLILLLLPSKPQNNHPLSQAAPAMPRSTACETPPPRLPIDEWPRRVEVCARSHLSGPCVHPAHGIDRPAGAGRRSAFSPSYMSSCHDRNVDGCLLQHAMSVRNYPGSKADHL
jgi:hypothetical protein